MSTYLLTWNPSRFDFSDYLNFVATTTSGQLACFRWSTGNRQAMKPGDRIFFLRQSRERGIIGSGFATAHPIVAPHWSRTDRNAIYVDVEWEHLVVPWDRLQIEELRTFKFDIVWDRIQSSSIQVPDRTAELLERVWGRHLEKLGRNLNTRQVEVLPNELQGTERLCEGAVRTITINSYERNPSARRRCIEHYGDACSVCGIRFVAVYGELGEGFIHVHHVRDIASIGHEYEIDPIADLRPVCPNCHAMLHKNSPTMSVEELQRRFRPQGWQRPPNHT